MTKGDVLCIDVIKPVRLQFCNMGSVRVDLTQLLGMALLSRSLYFRLLFHWPI
jgi:hypothetical protein